MSEPDVFEIVGRYLRRKMALPRLSLTQALRG